MGNVLYEFLPGRTITPYVGAGVGVDFVDGVSNSASTVFAYQSIVDAGWNSMTPHRVEILVR
jgi:hypothetical protein